MIHKWFIGFIRYPFVTFRHFSCSFCRTPFLLHPLIREEHSANVHRGAYALAERATEAQTWQPMAFWWIEMIELIGLYDIVCTYAWKYPTGCALDVPLGLRACEKQRGRTHWCQESRGVSWNRSKFSVESPKAGQIAPEWPFVGQQSAVRGGFGHYETPRGFWPLLSWDEVVSRQQLWWHVQTFTSSVATTSRAKT